MAIDRKLIDYLPHFMQDYAELRTIMDTEQVEFEQAWEDAENALSNQFILDANTYGVSRWESMLGISPKDTDTLDERKFRILTRLNQELPYTLTRLKEALTTLCGADGFVIDLQPNAYRINIKLAVGNHSNYQEVARLVNKMVPANLIQFVQLMYNTHATVGTFRHSELAERTHINIRSEVLTDA